MSIKDEARLETISPHLSFEEKLVETYSVGLCSVKVIWFLELASSSYKLT